MNAGWVEPHALAEGAALGNLEDWAGRPRRPARTSRRFWPVLVVAAIAAAALALSPYARQRGESPRAEPSVAPATGFESRADLPALLYVRALDGGAAAIAYDVERRVGDGARRDALTLGDPFSDGPFLRAVARTGGTPAHPSLFFVEIARQAAEIGEAVARASNPEASEGALYAEVALEAAGGQRACIAFLAPRLAGNELSGLACGGVGQPYARSSLECLISRIEPTAAGGAAGLDKLLKGLIARRSAC